MTQEQKTREKLVNSLVIKHVRVCRSLHACVLCPDPIAFGQRYFDGGTDRRAHTTCVKQERNKVKEK